MTKRRRSGRAAGAGPVKAAGGPAAGPAFWLIAGAAALWYAAFIGRTTFVIGGTRYFCLFDDAMISMRYARNLVHGLGLVYNPGDRPVEGITNPLWTLIMAAAHLVRLCSCKVWAPPY